MSPEIRNRGRGTSGPKKGHMSAKNKLKKSYLKLYNPCTCTIFSLFVSLNADIRVLFQFYQHHGRINDSFNRYIDRFYYLGRIQDDKLTIRTLDKMLTKQTAVLLGLISVS